MCLFLLEPQNITIQGHGQDQEKESENQVRNLMCWNIA